MDYYEAYLAKLASMYPKTAASLNLREALSPTLVSPRILELPKEMKTRVVEIVRAFSEVRELQDRNRDLASREPKTPNPKNYSALMSYDFHNLEDGSLKLIEINTNASNGLTMDASYKAHEMENGFNPDFQKEILETFREEFRLFAPDRELKTIAIVDENPTQQKLYFEFCLYQETFLDSGIECRIVDPTQLKFEGGKLRDEVGVIDLVYNRHTDFYLEDQSQSAMREAYFANAACFSPNPHEYRLLADKERLLELSRPGAIDELAISDQAKKSIQSCLLETVDVKDFEPETLWQSRKTWFFKPRRSHGGKAVYKGSSITKSTFATVVAGDFVAQKTAPPPTVKFGADEYKYDLRFHAYQDRVQLASARLYQGQITNARTAGGGATVIRWI